MTYTIHTRPVQDTDYDYSNYEDADSPFNNWHWKLTRDEPTPLDTIDGLRTVTVATGFASTRHRARSKAEKAARKDQKRRRKAEDPQRQTEEYEYRVHPDA